MLSLLAAILLTTTAGGPSYGLVPNEAFLRRQVAEPVFAFVFQLVEDDSLGTWTRDDLTAFAAGWERPSDFPLEHLRSLTREALPPDATVKRGQFVCDRRIVITLDQDRLALPMPYDILGYHPGTLSLGSPIEVREWHLGAREFRVRTGEGSRRETVRALTVFQVQRGWAILDVDAWLDRLLGGKLDDAATLGFITGRVHGRILGVGTSAGREGRFIYGELDFEAGTVAAHGRPLARAVAGQTRRWTNPDSGDRTDSWRGYD